MATPGNADKVMHASFQIGDTTVMASDGRNEGKPNFHGFALTIAARTRPRPTSCLPRSAKAAR